MHSLHRLRGGVPGRSAASGTVLVLRAKNFGKAQEYGLFDCIECGCCELRLPSHIPLVQYYRFAKGEIWAHEKEKHAADQARNRYEFRQLRIERDKVEKAERLAARQAAARTAAETNAGIAQGSASDESSTKKAAIAAAIARTKAKKAGIVPKNTDNLTPAQRAEINEIDARRREIEKLARKNIEPGNED